MAYDLEAFLRHILAGGNDVTPNGFLGQAVPDHEVPDEFRTFVHELLGHGIVEDTVQRGRRASMPARVRVTSLGRQMIGA